MVLMPATEIMLAPCWKPVMNLMALVNVRKTFIALPASKAFLTLTYTIKFIAGFWQGTNRITVTGIATCASRKTPVICLTAKMRKKTETSFIQ